MFSQNNEDDIIQELIQSIGMTDPGFFVEIGVGDGSQNNTRALAETHGWNGIWIDKEPVEEVPGRVRFLRKLITPSNIQSTFCELSVPLLMGVLSIDIDGHDYWIWRALRGWRPKIVIIEYNGHYPPPWSRTIPYEPEFEWTGSRYFGATLSALDNLARRRDYKLVRCSDNGVNAFFVRGDLWQGPSVDPADAYIPFAEQFPEDDREMIEV
jgi:hypothetical protein